MGNNNADDLNNDADNVIEYDFACFQSTKEGIKSLSIAADRTYPDKEH